MRMTASLLILALVAVFATGLAVSTTPASRVIAQQDVLEKACSANSDAVACQDRSQAQSESAFFGDSGLFTNVARIISIIAGVIAVFMIVTGAFKFITASGDSSKIQSARSSIIYGIVGILVAAAAQAIIVFALNRIGL